MVRTCRTSSFCSVAWQLARFQLTRRIARSLGDTGPVSVDATEREEHDTLQRRQRTSNCSQFMCRVVLEMCDTQTDRRTHHNTWLPTRGGVITSESVVRVMQLLLYDFAPHYFSHVSSQCLWLATTCYGNFEHQHVGFQLLLWPIFNL